MTIKDALESGLSTMAGQFIADCPQEQDIDQPSDGSKLHIGLLLILATLAIACAGVLVACWPKG